MEKNENGYSEYRFGRNGTNGNKAGIPNSGMNNGGCKELEPRNGYSNGTNSTGELNGNGSDGNGMNGDCNGSFGSEKRQLAMVYSPYQCWRMIYSPDDALAHGTLFEELYKPLAECDYNGK